MGSMIKFVRRYVLARSLFDFRYVLARSLFDFLKGH